MMYRLTKSVLQCLPLLIAIGCATSGKTDPELTGKVPNHTGQQIPGDAITDWQKFFKPSPGPQERDLLARKIATWQDTIDASSLVDRGRNELALGQLKAAETSFRQALRQDGDNLDASLELASIYIKKQDTGKAFEFLATVRREISLRDDVSRKFIYQYQYVSALGHLARGDRVKGHEILSDLINKEPSFSPAYAALASSYIEQDKTEIAEFVVQRGLDRGKPSPGLFNLMAVVDIRKQREASARNWIERALTASPGYAPALVNRARLAMNQLEYESAEADLKSALVSDPMSIDALVALGVALKHQGKLEEAKTTLEKALDVSPESASARYNLAILMAENLERPHVAARLFHEVTQASPANSRIHRMAKRYLHQLEDHTERL